MRERHVFREYLESLLVALIIALLLRTFVVAAYKIPTGSMIPTLKIGDCLFAYKIPFGVRIPFTKNNLIAPRMPRRGEVIVFRYPEDESLSFIKRVVGLPGDKIEIKQKHLFINDKMADYEPTTNETIGDVPNKDLYLVQKEGFDGQWHQVMFRRGDDFDDYGPEVVPSGHLFVLGDNRNNSSDSHSWGLLPMDKVIGRAIVSYWPPSEWRIISNPVAASP